MLPVEYGVLLCISETTNCYRLLCYEKVVKAWSWCDIKAASHLYCDDGTNNTRHCSVDGVPNLTRGKYKYKLFNMIPPLCSAAFISYLKEFRMSVRSLLNICILRIYVGN